MNTGVVHQLTNTAIFIATPVKKHIYQFILPKGFFYQFGDKKVMDLVQKNYPLAGDRSQVSIFFLT